MEGVTDMAFGRRLPRLRAPLAPARAGHSRSALAARAPHAPHALRVLHAPHILHASHALRTRRAPRALHARRPVAVATVRSQRAAAFLLACLVTLAASLTAPAAAHAQESATLSLRGKPQTLRLYGPKQGEPVIVSSGDGGWVHLAPHVAETLAARGYFVIGFDTRAYLSSFTTGAAALRPEDEPGDFETLARYAAGGRDARPLLIGVSEGAGLSVLAATDPKTRGAIGGVVALGLPDINELGWRWRDAIIYLTKGVPREPTFSARQIIARAAPAALAIIASTHDEFMTLADTRALFDAAKDPKKLWTIEAADHRFSDNLAEFDRRLVEAIAWIKSAR